MQPSLPELHPTAKALLTVIEAHAKLGERALSNERYAELLDVSISVQKIALKSLLKAGLLEVQSNGSHERRFRATRIDAWTKCSSKDFRVKPKAIRSKRRCMCCGEGFPSEGIHHRICSPCKDRDGPPPYPAISAANRRHAASSDSRDTNRPHEFPQPACHGQPQAQ